MGIMSRMPRNVFLGMPHHVTQRGNNKQDVFLCDEDRINYLLWLNYYRKKYQLDIWAYCLMSNHLHLIAVPHKPDSLSRTMAITHMVYSQYINRKHNRSGHLWQGRYYSCPMDEEYLLRAAIYIERNPVRAELVAKAKDWHFSSARARKEGVTDPLLKGSPWPTSDLLASWDGYLDDDDDPQTVTMIREQTETGRPLGSHNFISELETISGRILQSAPRGRPKSKQKNQ